MPPKRKAKKVLAEEKACPPCSFCYKTLTPAQIKRCPDCRKRIYCSNECQLADYEPGGGGQGHKTWCPLGCGEDGTDWEVKWMSKEKGLGLVAKRAFKAGERIMVERGFRLEALKKRTEEEAKEKDSGGGTLTAALATIMPWDGTVEDKFCLNAMLAAEEDPPAFASPFAFIDDDSDMLCIRMCRANHWCRGNAYYEYDRKAKVMLLIAKTAIRAGDEVCIEYIPVSDEESAFEPAAAAELLFHKWGIVCPRHCPCKER